jgi:hypothetical protein
VIDGRHLLIAHDETDFRCPVIELLRGPRRAGGNLVGLPYSCRRPNSWPKHQLSVSIHPEKVVLLWRYESISVAGRLQRKVGGISITL